MKDAFRHWLRRTISPRLLNRVNHLSHLEDRLYDLEARRAQLAEIVLRERYASLFAHPAGDEFRVFSQNGEDGILLSLLQRVGAPGKRFVEIGVEHARECNCGVLGFVLGWNGRLVEANPLSAAAARRFAERLLVGRANQVEIVETRASCANINNLIGPQPLDVLSIDVDSIDYWLWEAVTATPRVVIVEYNASFGLEPVILPRDATPHGYYHGASLTALARLGAGKGYSLVAVDSQGVNAFFVLDSVRPPSLAARQPEVLFRPHAMRCRVHSPEEQWAQVRGLPLERV
jgi:hypothetical protein